MCMLLVSGEDMPHTHTQFNPSPCRVLGVFGLSLYTGEKEIKEMFDRYGPLDRVQVVYDHQVGVAFCKVPVASTVH